MNSLNDRPDESASARSAAFCIGWTRIEMESVPGIGSTKADQDARARTLVPDASHRHGVGGNGAARVVRSGGAAVARGREAPRSESPRGASPRCSLPCAAVAVGAGFHSLRGGCISGSSGLRTALQGPAATPVLGLQDRVEAQKALPELVPTRCLKGHHSRGRPRACAGGLVLDVPGLTVVRGGESFGDLAAWTEGQCGSGLVRRGGRKEAWTEAVSRRSGIGW